MNTARKAKTVQRRKTVILDLGNALWKGMEEGRLDTVVTIPHAIKQMSKEKFLEVQSRMKSGYGRGNSRSADLFMYNGSYYAVGDTAERLGADTRRSGGVKYQPDYYPVAMLAVLLSIYPQGIDGPITVWAAYPPGDIRFRDDLHAVLMGKHEVETASGDKLLFHVKGVGSYDEPVGGLWNYLLDNTGQFYNRRNMPSGYGIAFDLGGKISNLVPFDTTGKVFYEQAISVDIGIQDVMQQVSDILLATPEYAEYFRAQRGSLPFDEDMRYAIKYGRYPCAGTEISALNAVVDATSNLRNQIKQVYDQRLGGPRPYRFAVITGGGGGLMFAQMVEHVIGMPPNRIYPAHDNMDQMHLANLLGGDKAWAAMQAAQNAR